MICIVMEEPLKDGEIGNIRENLKDFIHLGQLLLRKCPTEKYVIIKAVFQMAMHIRNCLTYGGRFINWR